MTREKCGKTEKVLEGEAILLKRVPRSKLERNNGRSWVRSCEKLRGSTPEHSEKRSSGRKKRRRSLKGATVQMKTQRVNVIELDALEKIKVQGRSIDVDQNNEKTED